MTPPSRTAEKGDGEARLAKAREAVKLLGRVDKAAAINLQRLLSLKTKAGYSTRTASSADVAQARRAHLALLEAAIAVR